MNPLQSKPPFDGDALPQTYGKPKYCCALPITSGAGAGPGVGSGFLSSFLGASFLGSSFFRCFFFELVHRCLLVPLAEQVPLVLVELAHL